MSWQLQFKMCLQKCSEKCFFEQGPHCGNCSTDSLLKAPQREQKRHDRWRSNTGIIPTICLMRGNSGKTKRHGYRRTQTLTHKATRWVIGPGFLYVCQMKDRIKSALESRFRLINIRCFLHVFTKTGHEVEGQTEREQTEAWEEPSHNARGVKVPIILCSNSLPNRSGWFRFFLFSVLGILPLLISSACV